MYRDVHIMWYYFAPFSIKNLCCGSLVIGAVYLKPNEHMQLETGNQRTNGPVNAHLIFGPRISV